MLRMQPLPLTLNTIMMMMLLCMFCDDRSLVFAPPFWSAYEMGHGHGIYSEKWERKSAYFTTTTRHATLLKLATSFKSRQLISYCTGRYSQNFPFQWLNQYQNIVISCRFKYRLYRHCFGHRAIHTGFQPDNDYQAEIEITPNDLKTLSQWLSLSSSHQIWPSLSLFPP